MDAFRQALKLKPDLILPKANLAVAYLVRPPTQTGESAAAMFEQLVAALQDAKSTEALDPLARAELLVNAGVAEFSAQHAEASQKFFDQAREVLDKVGPAANQHPAAGGRGRVAGPAVQPRLPAGGVER